MVICGSQQLTTLLKAEEAELLERIRVLELELELELEGET